MKTCTKVYSDIPFAHRAPLHDGHCRLIHGHNWTFEITFAASEPDRNGFIVDFGKLHTLKSEFDLMFDHTLVLNEKDPLLEDVTAFLQTFHINNVRRMPDCSCEGIAQFVFDLADSFIRKETSDRAQVRSVIVHEDHKNSAFYAGE